MARPVSTALVLGSGSSARLRVLQDAGIDPVVVVSGVDESCDEDLDTPTLVRVLAERKATAVAALRPDALVLGCDSMLDVGRTPFGKPVSAEEAVQMWQRQAGHDGTLYSGHCLIDGPTGRRVTGVAAAVIRFGTPDPAELTAYVANGEPLMMAGAFTVEGFGAPFVDSIDGHPSTVMGLSLPLLRRMLADLGVAMTDLWRSADQRGLAR